MYCVRAFQAKSSFLKRKISGDSFCDIKEHLWNTINKEIGLHDCSFYRSDFAFLAH